MEELFVTEDISEDGIMYVYFSKIGDTLFVYDTIYSTPLTNQIT